MTYQPYLWPTYKKLLLKSSRPILVGPFLGEAGIEALYWLSFIENLKQAGIKPERLIPIGRGGSACWYGTPTGVEIYAMRTPQQVRVESTVRRMKTGMMKQLAWTPFDRAIVTDAAQSLGLKKYLTLHPSWMFQTLSPYWAGMRGMDWLHGRCTYAFLPPPPLPAGVQLPPEFVAVKFYFRSTFEYKHDALQLAKTTVKKLAETIPVVILNTGIHSDDHRDLQFKAHPHITVLKDLMPLTPQNTLWAQSAVLARAQGFVGTYGGLAQVAQRFKKPAVTFFTSWGGTLMQHKHLSDAIALRTGVPFLVQNVKELPLLATVLPMIQSQQPLTTVTTNRTPLAEGEPVA